MPGMMQKLLEWIAKRDGEHMMTLTDHSWFYERDTDGDYELTAEEIVKLYFEQSKQKDNEQGA